MYCKPTFKVEVLLRGFCRMLLLVTTIPSAIFYSWVYYMLHWHVNFTIFVLLKEFNLTRLYYEILMIQECNVCIMSK